jgi:hypothetical protein
MRFGDPARNTLLQSPQSYQATTKVLSVLTGTDRRLNAPGQVELVDVVRAGSALLLHLEEGAGEAMDAKHRDGEQARDLEDRGAEVEHDVVLEGPAHTKLGCQRPGWMDVEAVICDMCFALCASLLSDAAELTLRILQA